MATQTHEFRDDGSDFDVDEEDYFARTYQPLSNLPTPPPSSRGSSASDSPQSLLEDGERLNPALLGPAVHLVNLVPPAASLTTPSVQLVHAILTRSSLPLDTIGLAVCILDSLDHKFSLNWRLVCPLAGFDLLSPASSSKRHTIPSTHMASSRQLHIDSVHPELIILASLVIAYKFLEDRHESTQYYGYQWGRNLWTCEQINATERCIMENLGYRILPLWDQDLIGDAILDMERAGRYASGSSGREAARGGGLDGKDDNHKRSMSSGKAVTGLGMQLTPAETPVCEMQRLCPPAQRLVDNEVRAAFRGAHAGISAGSLRLLSERGKKQVVEGLHV